MLRLKIITKTDDVLIAIYEPENSGEIGKIIIDLPSKKVIKADLTTFDTDTMATYANHAKNAIFDMLESGKLIEERYVMWY